MARSHSWAFSGSSTRTLAGTWYSDELEASIELAPIRGGMKIVDKLQVDPGPLHALGRDILVSNEGFTIEIERDGANQATGLLVSTKGARGIRYTRRD